jgi:hypothetical protein
MAKAMKMSDKKNFGDRVRKSFNGNYTGVSSTNRSKYLAIKYDLKHGVIISEDKKKFIEEYEKEEIINKL